MEDINQHTPDSAFIEFAPAQRQALATWAQGYSDYRLEITRCQLYEAIGRYNNTDEILTGLALVARTEAVNEEISRRGGVPLSDPILIPWGKSITSVEEWTLTDFTRLPPLNNQQTQAQTIVHPPTVTDTVAGQENPKTPWAVINHPTLTYRLVTKDAHNLSAPRDADLLVSFVNTIIAAAIKEMHGTGIASDQLYNVWVIDRANNPTDAEIYRLADNDTSGLPIISSSTLDVENDNTLADTTIIIDECMQDVTIGEGLGHANIDAHMGDAAIGEYIGNAFDHDDGKFDDFFTDFLNHDAPPDLWQPGV